ncbi:MAG: cell wall-binding repeat-containing protein [Acidimicrobiales bacterium]
MSRALFRLLFGALALMLVSGLQVVVTGSAGATGSGITATASGTPPIPSTGNGTSGAGSLTITLAPTLESATFTLTLRVSASNGATVSWAHFKVTTARISTIGSPTVHSTRLAIELSGEESGISATVHLSGIEYTSESATGTADVTVSVGSHRSTVTNGTFYTEPTAPSLSLTATASPTDISAGDASASAATWVLKLSGTETGPSGWAKDDEIEISVSPPGGTGCAADGGLSFWDSPAVTYETPSGVSATPDFSEKLTSTCGVDTPNELVLTFTDAGVFDEPTAGTAKIKVTGIRYSVGSTASKVGTGDVVVHASFYEVTSSTTVTIAGTGAANSVLVTATSGSTTASGGTGAATGGPTGSLTVSADTPPVSVLPAAADVVMSPVSVVESSPGQLRTGDVCVTLSAGGFDAAVQPTVSAQGGDGQVSSTVSYQGDDDGAAPTVVFRVLKVSTTATTYVLTGLAVDAPGDQGAVDVEVTRGTSAQCDIDTQKVGTAEAFAVVGTPVTRIAGTTADGTAAAELEHQFDPSRTQCPGTENSRPVVLTTDAGYSDALSSSYLASTLGTGELLTTPGNLSREAEDAIEREGITNVYVIGGALAVTPGVVDQLEALPVDACGGGVLTGPSDSEHVQVTRIYGQTEYETAEWVAEYPQATNIGSVDIAGAYGGSNQTLGTGEYNDTAGSASSAPPAAGALPTAIVATGRGFQDAEASSALSYAERLPILLTTPSTLSAPTEAALSDLGVRQVIVMGGPDAVSDTVVDALEDLGLSVVRVAGRTYSATAIELAELELAPSSTGLGLGWSPTGNVTVARGDGFSDGIAGAVVAADAQPGTGASAPRPEPLVLTTGPATVGPYLSAFLLEAGVKGVDGTAAAKIDTLTVLGGTGAVTVTSVDAMLADL